VVREAKTDTSWVSPNAPYETAVSKFVEGLFAARRRQPFLNDLDEFSHRVGVHGRWNSLTQLVLKMTSPGIPDFYQGTEGWNLTLVDPDNRQIVNFHTYRDRLNGLLTEMADALGHSENASAVETWLDCKGPPSDATAANVANLVHRLLEDCQNGLLKLFTTLIGLRTRRRFPQLFAAGEYEPLTVTGTFSEHVIAFLRRHEDQTMVVAVPRLTVRLAGFGGNPPIGGIWHDTRLHLPPACLGTRFTDVFTRSAIVPDGLTPSLAVSDVLHRLPFAVLLNSSS
jgi:(1->4)-alpha-D-glucan 1-alpha-D-glucosylmutase